MLTDEQKKLVEENHSLIYWYAHKSKLDLDKWYGLLAIELCKAVMKYDSNRGELSTYFKLRADHLVMKEFKKETALKRNDYNEVSLDALYDLEELAVSGDVFLESELMKYDEHGILKLKLLGHTQQEIADKLNVTQPYISKWLNSFKERYYGNDDR